MRNRWVISVPVWGEHYVYVFLCYVLPSIKIAIKEAGVEARLILHTDDLRQDMNLFKGMDVEIRKPVHGNTHHDTYGDCHRDVVASAKPGERVALLNADIVLSKEVFAACEKRFSEGKKLIICAATRCLFKEGVYPPIGARSRNLLDWSLKVKHPSVAECFWGTGHTMIPWAVYFQGESGVVVRGFHLHPLAFVKREGLTFHGVSLDEHLIDEFTKEEIHVVTTPDELALAELSLPTYLFMLLPHLITEKSIFTWALHRTTARHRWLFEHRIVVSGTGDDMLDIEPCNTVMEKFKWARQDTFNGPLPLHFTMALADSAYTGCRDVLVRHEAVK